jgi:hypothetical protein
METFFTIKQYVQIFFKIMKSVPQCMNALVCRETGPLIRKKLHDRKSVKV